jgi:hypothetical protein
MGNVLRLVDDCTLREPGKKPLRVPDGELALVRGFQRDIPFPGNVARANVVLPACLGPVTTRTRNPFARRCRVSAAVRGIALYSSTMRSWEWPRECPPPVLLLSEI